jgi:hypothetical protein
MGGLDRRPPCRIGAEPAAGTGPGLAEAERFALAGGAALIARGHVHRETRDLDFFGLTPDAVDRLLPALDQALQDAGLRVRRLQENHGFARLIVESNDDRTEHDQGADARMFPAEPGTPAPTPSGEELAVDKVLAVFGRAEARDFVHLAAIEEPNGLERLFDLAAEKDRGFTRELFAETAGRFSRLRRDEFGIDPAAYAELTARVATWRERALSV